MKILDVTVYACLACLCYVGVVSCSFLTPVISIEQGKLRGLRSPAGVDWFLGIPYASSKRFQPPKQPRRWTKVYDAVNSLTACAQLATFSISTVEDCLYLNVFTLSRAKPGDKLPVFVFLHGGAYFIMSKGVFDPEFLVTKNIVAVTVNYRLGALGFLCVNGVANLGLKDQTAALKWVRKNIVAFGGDPNHVTLVGQSAGAASAALHMLSEKSAGLFHKVILMSGSAFSPWAFNSEPLTPALMDANKIADAHTEEDVYKIFASAPIFELLSATRGIETFDTRYLKYSPCIDSHLPDPFFRDTPYEIIKSGRFNKVPVMIGVTSQEGILFYGTHRRKTFAEWNANFVERLPSLFSWCSEADRRKISDKMRTHYFGNQPISERAVEGFVRYYSDWIDFGTFDAYAQLIAQYSEQPVYKFAFSYVGGRNYAKLTARAAALLPGAAHCDDLFYLFKPAGLSVPMSKDDKLFVSRYTTLLANFVKYSNPTPHTTPLLPVQWPSTTGNQSFILQLDHELRLARGPWQQDDFYLQQLCTHGRTGYVPCDSQQQCEPDQTFRTRYSHDRDNSSSEDLHK